MSDDVNDVEKEKRIIIIQTLLAFELFCQKRFEESLRNFANLNTGMHKIIQISIKRFVDLVRILDAYETKLEKCCDACVNFEGVRVESLLD